MNPSSLAAGIRLLRNFNSHNNKPIEYLSALREKFENFKENDFTTNQQIMILQGVRSVTPSSVVPDFTDKLSSWIDDLDINPKTLETIGRSLAHVREIPTELLEKLTEKIKSVEEPSKFTGKQIANIAASLDNLDHQTKIPQEFMQEINRLVLAKEKMDLKDINCMLKKFIFCSRTSSS